MLHSCTYCMLLACIHKMQCSWIYDMLSSYYTWFCIHACTTCYIYACLWCIHASIQCYIHPYRVIAASMDILHAMSWELTMDHIAAPEDSHARQHLHITVHIHAYTKCSIHAYIECYVNAWIGCYIIAYIGCHIDAYIVCYMIAYILNYIHALLTMYWMQCSCI